ncbi:hypothetical protein GW943_01845 [Candidatus Parcubacteria bacterium]|uniref:SHS2 domain-containing protein n=1 Tax=Candidatus Kaiserbacteria bacterium CG10_big_fil_rev_8_21_14_0_10_47_16 TaxID=1974608 RepID=A0A2H0UG46_9BACT|nr:hypothetical protein [Candidatus Parcubacteria bacterium]PIR84775.1 MAG: hypothetical protein COU16_01135 [Candidatus Kaiserbacteria bacterium CG10_big_fil_rev_8_21_14_0_10_47_16]
MFGIGKKSGDTTYAACLDIGSGSVGIAIIASNPAASAPEIVFSDRVPMRLTQNRDGKTLLHALKEALMTVVSRIDTAGLSALHKTHPHARITTLQVTSSAPWAYTVKRTVRLEHDEPTKITKELFTELQEKANKESEKSVNENDVARMYELRVVEHATVYTKINDYIVVNPVGKMGTSFELVQMIQLIPEPVIDLVEHIQSRIFPHARIKIHTYVCSLYSVVRDLAPNVHNATFIDVSAEATEIGVMEDGILGTVMHIPTGYNSLIRNQSAKKHVPAAHATSSLRAFTDGTLEESDRGAVTACISEYQKTLIAALKVLAQSGHIPPHIVLTSSTGIDTLLQESVVAAVGAITPIPATLIDLTALYGEQAHTGPHMDTFLQVTTRFFHKVHHTV